MKHIAELAARVAELERRLAQASRSGTVAEVNAALGLVRLNLGAATGGGNLLSPWIKYAQTGGALKVHSPPTVGQQMTLNSPSGDLAQGIAMPLGFSDANPSPSGSAAQNVITFGSATITLASGALTIAVGGTTLVIASGGVTVTGGTVTHNSKNIGATHRHSGVVIGVQNTEAPI